MTYEVVDCPYMGFVESETFTIMLLLDNLSIWQSAHFLTICPSAHFLTICQFLSTFRHSLVSSLLPTSHALSIFSLIQQFHFFTLVRNFNSKSWSKVTEHSFVPHSLFKVLSFCFQGDALLYLRELSYPTRSSLPGCKRRTQAMSWFFLSTDNFLWELIR